MIGNLRGTDEAGELILVYQPQPKEYAAWIDWSDAPGGTIATCGRVDPELGGAVEVHEKLVPRA
jgi:hypothetical protein